MVHILRAWDFFFLFLKVEFLFFYSGPKKRHINKAHIHNFPTQAFICRSVDQINSCESVNVVILLETIIENIRKSEVLEELLQDSLKNKLYWRYFVIPSPRVHHGTWNPSPVHQKKRHRGLDGHSTEKEWAPCENERLEAREKWRLWSMIFLYGPTSWTRTL